MPGKVYVINASSRRDTGITEELACSLAWLRGPDLPTIECVTLSDGPNGIVNARDSDLAAPAVLRFIEKEAPREDVAAFVVGCFSDPGVLAAREMTRKPVIGIGEAGLMAALALGDLVGIIGVSTESAASAARAARRLGFGDRIAGRSGLGLDYADLRHPALVVDKLAEAALHLRDRMGANSLIFAAAGLGRYVSTLRAATGLPTVDPTLAAVTLALTQVGGQDL